MLIKVFVCPTEGCGNYYASSSQVDRMNTVVGQKDINFAPRSPGDPNIAKRSECPDCRTRGNRVERIAVEVETGIPAVVAA